MERLIYITAILLLLNACASKLPPGIAHAPVQQPNLAQVQAQPQAYLGKAVRWGGEVIEVRNKPEHTDIVMLARVLQDDGEPVSDGSHLGRFLARHSGFVDPSLFAAGTRVTFSGLVLGVEKYLVGEYAYPYPVIQVESWHIWPEPEPRRYYYDPWPYGWGYYPGYPRRWYPYWWW